MTAKKGKELLPCPFCGDSAGQVDLRRGHGFIIGCGGCPAQVFSMELQEAIAAWNRRPEASIEQEQPVYSEEQVEVMIVNALKHKRVTAAMADRFLRWPLPFSVCADPCTTKQQDGRVGTNLLSAIEAKQMLEYVLATGTEPTIPAAQIIPEGSAVEQRTEAEITGRADDIAEWMNHLDLHLTEHDLPHAGKALRAAWPQISTYIFLIENERNTFRELVAVESIEQDARCNWAQGSNGEWLTDCGHIFEFTTGTPAENHAKFCQYCGSVIAALQEKQK